MKVAPSRPNVEDEFAPARRQTNAMIAIDSVSHVFRTSGRQDHLALSNISLTIEDGAFVAILGPSGCGKSTLLYVVGGFVSPTEGVARVKGRAIKGPGPDRGPVFQEFALFPWKSVLGNVMYGPRQQGVKSAEAEAQSRALIEMVGLKGFEHFYPKELSGGMKQRVALARTLAYHPAVLLMDEPFGALDAHTRTRLQNDLLNIWERDRKTVLFVTHSVADAVFLSDKAVMLTRGPGRIRQSVDQHPGVAAPDGDRLWRGGRDVDSARADDGPQPHRGVVLQPAADGDLSGAESRVDADHHALARRRRHREDAGDLSRRQPSGDLSQLCRRKGGRGKDAVVGRRDGTVGGATHDADRAACRIAGNSDGLPHRPRAGADHHDHQRDDRVAIRRRKHPVQRARHGAVRHGVRNDHHCRRD